LTFFLNDTSDQGKKLMIFCAEILRDRA